MLHDHIIFRPFAVSYLKLGKLTFPQLEVCAAH